VSCSRKGDVLALGGRKGNLGLELAGPADGTSAECNNVASARQYAIPKMTKLLLPTPDKNNSTNMSKEKSTWDEEEDLEF